MLPRPRDRRTKQADQDRQSAHLRKENNAPGEEPLARARLEKR
jgi:hypothetical protein